jgi:hypothetical protein
MGLLVPQTYESKSQEMKSKTRDRAWTTQETNVDTL